MIYLAGIWVGGDTEDGLPVIDTGKCTVVRIKRANASLALQRAKQIAFERGGVLLVFEDKFLCKCVSRTPPKLHDGVALVVHSIEDDVPSVKPHKC